MNEYRSSRLVRACVGMMGLGGLLAAGAGSAWAQDTTAAQASDSAPMTLIVAVFPDQAGAGQAMNQMRSAQKGQVQSYAVLSKDTNGKVKVHDRKSKKGTQGARAKDTIDGAVALLGRSPNQQPSQPATDTASGGAADSSRRNAAGQRDSSGQQAMSARPAGVSQADADKISAMLPPDNSAILLVVPATAAPPIDASIEQAHPSQMVGAELVPVP